MPRAPGPRPLPANVIELRGNPSGLSKDEIARRREAQFKPRVVDLPPPRELSRFERDCWVHHSHELARVGLLTELDVGAYRLMCASYAIAMEALESLRPTDKRRKGLAVIIPDRKYGGTKRAPGAGTFFQAAREYRSWAVEFGLTPSARVSMSALFSAGEEGNDDDLFE